MGAAPNAWRFGPFDLDVRERRLARAGAPLRLAPKAFDLLTLLVERNGRLLRKRELMDALWPDTVVGDASLARLVSALRQALGDGRGQERLIETVSKSGYRFRAAVLPLGPAPRTGLARERYLRGRYLWGRRSPQALEKAVRAFDGALELDPGLAAAHAGRADALSLLAGYGRPPAAFAEARASAQRALALDAGLSDAHAALGLIAQKRSADWERAEAEYRLALTIEPSHLTALQRLGELLALRGRFGEGLEMLEEARRLDPVSSSIGADLAKACVYARRYARARQESLSVLDIDPSFARARLYLGLALLLDGDTAAGLGELQAFAVEEDSAYAWGVLAWAEAAAGRNDHARRLGRDLTRRGGFVPPYALLLARLAVDDREQALCVLGAMAAEGHNLLGLGVSPLLDPLRGNRRYESLVDRSRLVWSRSRDLAGPNRAMAS